MSYWKKFVEFLVGPGTFVADDKPTVDVNEAYEDGKPPVVKNKRTQTKGKSKGKGSQKSKSKKGRGRPKGSKNKKK